MKSNEMYMKSVIIARPNPTGQHAVTELDLLADAILLDLLLNVAVM